MEYIHCGNNTYQYNFEILTSHYKHQGIPNTHVYIVRMKYLTRQKLETFNINDSSN